MKTARLMVVGAGRIGVVHMKKVSEEAKLAAIVDPGADSQQHAERYSVPCYHELSDALTTEKPDGVVIATPNPLHAPQARECVRAGIPTLVEKPLTDRLDEGRLLVEEAELAGVPLLVGHHRRYNPLIRAARDLIEQGRLGTLVSIHAMCWLPKPESYFDIPWRRKAGAGPIMTNLIHDLDLMRYLCGDIDQVQAMSSSSVRGFEVEDTAVVSLRFACGALGTITLSDSVVAPWSWELTSGENPEYPTTGESCYVIGGTQASLSLPDFGVWEFNGKKGWDQPISRISMPHEQANPLNLQIRHFANVALGKASPEVPGSEGLKSLEVLDAIQTATQSARAANLSGNP